MGVYILLFLFGLAVGSFVNVVALRYEPGNRLFDSRIIGGRSHCPHCGNKLSPTGLIPVLSFVFLRGKCRSCKKKISFQYPVVELVSGCIWAFVPMRILYLSNLTAFSQPLILFSLVWIFVLSALLLLSIIDVRFFIIPDQINIFIALLAVAGVFANAHISFLGYYVNTLPSPSNPFLNSLSGGVFGALFFGAIILATRGRGMGWGDVKLAAALGLLFGFPTVLLAIVIAFLLGMVVSAPSLLLRKVGLKTAIPFGPFLGAGAALVFFFGLELLNWYFGAIQLFAAHIPV